MRRHISTKNSREAGLYLATGLLGSLVDTLTFAVLLWSGVSLVPSQWIGASAGAIHNSIIHHYIVFSHTRTLRQTVLPNIFLSLAFILASGPALLLLSQLVENLWVCKAIILSGTAISSYFIRKLIIFHR